MTAKPLSFQQQQYAFTAHVRNPDHQPTPSDVEPRRMAIYDELFYNNIQGFIADGFPVLRQITDDKRWHQMVRHFFVNYQCQTPYFAQISKEFVQYLQQDEQQLLDYPPYIAELAHYEWVELALSIANEETDRQGVDPNADLLLTIPVISDLAWNLAYQYPVHQISTENQPQQVSDSPSYLVVYRNRLDEVGFMEVNAVTHRLIDILESSQPTTGKQALHKLAVELTEIEQTQVMAFGVDVLTQLKQREIIIGGRTV